MTRSITTNDIPQADLIWDVARVPEAVAQGLTTKSQIAAYLGNKVPRQGLYYAQAAHTLGLVERDAGGELRLTTYGRAFIGYDRISKQRGLRRLVIECEPTRSLVAGLRASGGWAAMAWRASSKSWPTSRQHCVPASTDARAVAVRAWSGH